MRVRDVFVSQSVRPRIFMKLVFEYFRKSVEKIQV